MKTEKAKPRIALLGVATLGGGPLGHGIPSISDLFSRLSDYYTIVFYSFNPTDVTRIPKSITVRQTSGWRMPGRIKYILLSARLLWDHLLSRYDLIFAVAAYPAGQYAVVLGKIVKRPSVVQYIALEAVALTDIGYGNLAIPWLRKITKWVSQEATALVMVAEHQRKVALATLPSDRKMEVLPLRINPNHFHYRKKAVTFPVQLIHIAYYSPIKDQDTMFRAIAKVSKTIPCYLTVIGDGFNNPKVKTLLQELNISDLVTFKGLISQTELPQYLNDAHILVHPARFETGCAAIQEAMASGVAVCGTDVGILADLGDRYAAVVPVADPERLALGILQLVNNPETYQRITTEAHKWITEFDNRWSVENYHQFLDQLLVSNNR